MNVIRNGAIIGEIVLTGTTSECAYEGEHGSLPYGFIRHGAATPEIVVCDTHCHTDDGYFAGVLSKIQHPAGLVVTSPAPVTIDNGLLPCPFCGGAAVIELAWRKTGRWIAYCEDNCVGDIHTHYFGSEDEARASWNTRAPRTEELRTPTFDQVRDAIVERMGGHTIGERDLAAWTSFLGLLKRVRASECAMPSPQREPKA
jgi:hypothetical protein